MNKIFTFFFCRLLVGAPEADSGQPGVVKGGAVFKCPPESPGSCDLIQFDTKVSIIYFDLKYRFAQVISLEISTLENDCLHMYEK